MVSFFTLEGEGEGDHFAGADSCIAETWGEDTGGRSSWYLASFFLLSTLSSPRVLWPFLACLPSGESG